MALTSTYMYVLRRSDTKEFVSSILGIYYTKNLLEAQIFASSDVATATLINVAMKTKGVVNFEVVEFGLVPTRMVPFVLTDDIMLKRMSDPRMHVARAIHRHVQEDGTYMHYISYNGYEYSPNGASQFDLVAMYRTRGRTKLNVTAEGEHFNVYPDMVQHPRVVIVHGSIADRSIVEMWLRRNKTIKRKLKN